MYPSIFIKLVALVYAISLAAGETHPHKVPPSFVSAGVFFIEGRWFLAVSPTGFPSH